MTINPDSTNTGITLQLGAGQGNWRIMVEPRPDKHQPSLYERYKRLSTSKKVILLVFLIWFIHRSVSAGFIATPRPREALGPQRILENARMCPTVLCVDSWHLLQ